MLTSLWMELNNVWLNQNQRTLDKRKCVKEKQIKGASIDPTHSQNHPCTLFQVIYVKSQFSCWVFLLLIEWATKKKISIINYQALYVYLSCPMIYQTGTSISSCISLKGYNLIRPLTWILPLSSHQFDPHGANFLPILPVYNIHSSCISL